MPDIAAPIVTRLIDTPLAVGESIVWDQQGQCLWFVDILAPDIFRLDPGSRALERWEMPAAIGSLGLCADGRLVVALAAVASGILIVNRPAKA